MSMKKKCRHAKVGLDPRNCGCAWYADVYLEGKRTYINLGGDWIEARARHAQIVADSLNDRAVVALAKKKSARATEFGALADEWIDAAEINGARRSTIMQYRTIAARLREYFGDVQVARITEDDVLDFVKLAKREKSQAYAAQLWMSLKSILLMAEDNGMIVKAPIPRRGIKFGKSEPTERLTVAQARQEITNLRSPEIRLLAELILLTGMRVGEALALTTDAFDGETLTIRGTLLRNGKIGPPKTSTSYRSIVLTPRAIEIVRDRVTITQPGERIWPLSYTWVQAALAKERSNTRVTWHTFRHANATLRAEAAQDIRTQQVQMGHSNMQQTVAYGSASRRDAEEIARLDAIARGE